MPNGWHLDPKWLGFVIYLGLRMHQFKKYCLLKQGLSMLKQLVALYAPYTCLLYTYDAADDLTRVDLGGRRSSKQNIPQLYMSILKASVT